MATLLKCYKPLIPPIHRQTFKAKLLSSRANFRFCTLSSINCSNNSLPLTSNRERSTTVNDDNDSLIPMKKKELWLYNTMSRQKELFKPKVAAKVGMYVCGVTAYDLSHIGHARVYVSFDVMYRYILPLYTYLFIIVNLYTCRCIWSIRIVVKKNNWVK